MVAGRGETLGGGRLRPLRKVSEERDTVPGSLLCTMWGVLFTRVCRADCCLERQYAVACTGRESRESFALSERERVS